MEGSKFKLPLTKTVPGLFPAAIVAFPEKVTDASNPPFPRTYADALADPDMEIDDAGLMISTFKSLVLFLFYFYLLCLLFFSCLISYLYSRVRPKRFEPRC